jgi:hypothetical protein
MKVSIGKYPRKSGTERKVSVKIEPFDTWSLDHTLALIIHPALLQLQKEKHGSPFVDDEDVPEELRSTAAPKLTEKQKAFGSTDDFFHKRWEWVMGEMVWSFAQVLDDDADSIFYSGEHDFTFVEMNPEETDPEKKAYEMKRGPNDTFSFDREGYEIWSNRKKNGFKLFGKYYEALWD